jgi:hypothetical protein
MNRMFCYLWHEPRDDNECKFGERFVLDGQDPMTECRRRIRDSLGVRKDKFDEGSVIVDAIWDVSEWAEEVGRNRQHGKMDDYMRERIGFRKGSTGEIHKLNADVMALKVNQLLQQTNQPLITAGLSQWQYDQADNVLTAFAEGKRTMLAELCARFGKTIWAGALAVEMDAKMTIVASYVLTSFASFAKDLTAFEQFRNLVVVDSADPDYQTQIESASQQGKQVVVFLSMVGSKKRQDRIDYLFTHIDGCDRLVFIDEADYGAHTAKQSDPFVFARNPDDCVILMTGTNGERALGTWTIDHYLGTTYAELLMEKEGV